MSGTEVTPDVVKLNDELSTLREEQLWVGAGNRVIWVLNITLPKSIQIFTMVLTIPPTKAPFQLQKGTRTARKNTPSNGPRTAPNTDAAIATREPPTKSITKDEARQHNPNTTVRILVQCVLVDSSQSLKNGPRMSSNITADRVNGRR